MSRISTPCRLTKRTGLKLEDGARASDIGQLSSLGSRSICSAWANDLSALELRRATFGERLLCFAHIFRQLGLEIIFPLELDLDFEVIDGRGAGELANEAIALCRAP